MADADRIKVSFAKETTWGETPSPAPTLQDLRLTAESLSTETSTEDSKEIRNDRQKADTIRTAVQAAGEVNFELSYGTYDDFILGALFATDWSAEVTDVASDTSISANSVGNQLEGTDGEFTNYQVGEWVLIEGFSSTPNNGIGKITAINSSDPGVSDDDQLVIAGLTLTTEAAGNSISVTQLSSATNGTTQHSFVIEKQFTDLSNEFISFNGMTIDTWSLATALESIITGSFSFMGKTDAWATATIGDGSNAAPTTTQIMNCVDHIEKVLENYTAYEATEFSLELQNGLRTRGLLGQLAKDSIGTGLCNVTGTLKAYFEDSTTLQKYSNYVSTSLAIILKDNAGNRYIIDLPEVKLISATAVATGQSSDIIADMSFSAILDPTEGITLRVAKLPAA